MTYDSLILDHDGVIVDVLDREWRRTLFAQRAESIFRDYGVDPDEQALDRLVNGVVYDELLTLSDRLGADPEAVWKARDDTLAAVLQTAARNGDKTPYADVARLSEIDVPLGVASNNQRRVVRSMLAEFDLLAQFGTIHAREPLPESIRRKKPSPTFLERAMDDLGVSDPLYVGDKATDIQAGQRAGMDVALLRRAHNRDRSIEPEPTYEFTGLDEVVDLL